MALTFRSIFNIFSGGLRKEKGVQSPVPMRYNKAAATRVDFDSAMTVSAVWACARILSEAIAAMPLVCYRNRSDGTQEVVTDYPLWRLMNYQPNRYQTRTEFFETLALNLVMTGNCYCAIQRRPDGQIFSLLPLMSSQINVRVLDDGATVYEFTTGNTLRVYAAENIWHVKLFGNGIMGLSPLGYARNAIGLALSLDEEAMDQAANGFKTTGILMVDGLLKPEQRARIKENYKELTDGGNDRLFVLEAGMKYEQTSLSPEDAQMLQMKKYQVEDVARFFGVPSVLINDTSGSTTWGSGIAQIIDGFYKLNLRPYLERFESSIVRNLMPQYDWGRYSIEFDFDSLLRADLETRVKALKEAVNSGIMTPNEARTYEGRAGMEGGDQLLVNGTMIPVAMAGKQYDKNGMSNGDNNRQ